MAELYKCKACGGSVTPQENGIGKCDFCGAFQTLPKDSDDRMNNLLNRANDYRRSSEYDRAIYMYEEALKLNETEPEAHWGLFLSKYGVEYVQDSKTWEYKPTLHRISSVSVFDDIDYRATIKYADTYTAAQYREDAEVIEQVMRELLVVSANQEPYDIFLSYKEKDDITGQQTDDSHLAHELYNELVGRGYRVFFAPKSLGAGQYEPKIYAAIISAKVMIVLGTKPEYINAVWVKNEWSRFAELIDAGEDKVIIPVYKYMDVHELPNKLAAYQAYNMDSISFLPDVTNTIEKYVNHEETVRFDKNATAENAALERGFLALEDRDYTQANHFFEQVLSLNPHNPRAYFGKLMAEMRVPKQEQILTSPKPLNEYLNFEKAVRFADQQLKVTLLQYEEKVNETLNLQKYNSLCNELKGCSTNAHLYTLCKEFLSLPTVEGSAQKAAECLKKVKFSEPEELSELGEYYKKFGDAETAERCQRVSDEWQQYNKDYNNFSDKYTYFPMSLALFITFGVVVVIVGLITLLWGFVICAGIVLVEFLIRLVVVSIMKGKPTYKNKKQALERRKSELDSHIEALKSRA